MIRVTADAGGSGNIESFARVDNTASSSSSGKQQFQAYGGSDGSLPMPPPVRIQEQQQLTLKPLLTGQEVDDAIMEERERDIRKMNQDLKLVNEMFK